MSRGGARIGAGRPANRPNKTSALREQRVAQSGITPLDVMVDNMRVAYENALNSERQLKNIQIEGLNSEDAFKALLNAVRGVVNYRKIAEECARDAAVYVHPRLAQVEHTGEVTQNYVLRVPAAPASVDEWQQQNSNKPVQTIQ